MIPEQKEWPLVTANILAYNRKDLVRQTIQKTLYELDYPRDRLEIVVVDNESSDGTKEMIAEEFPEVKVVVIEKNMGVPAWNKGFEAGSGDYFLVLDDDCFITGDALKKAVSGAQEQDADLVSFLVLNGYDQSFVFNYAINTGIMEFWGCSALISKRAIDKLKGFDTNIKFLSHELEFTIRFFDQGFKHLFMPEVRSLHMKPPKLKKGEPRPKGAPTHDSLVRMQRWNLAYIAGKLLQPEDGRAALANMIFKMVIASFKKPLMITAIPRLIKGYRDGLENHAPVSPRVSAAYRQHFIEFVNPLSYAGFPRNRRRFLRSNRKFYPLKKATLQL